MSAGRTDRWKSPRSKRFVGPDADAFTVTMQVDRSTALDFAEHRLRRQPDKRDLLNRYVSEGRVQDSPRVETFLKSGLDHRPLAIDWHRAYQTLAELKGHEKELVLLYDRYLNAEPKNAGLIYLRGRVEPDWDQQDRYFDRPTHWIPGCPGRCWRWEFGPRRPDVGTTACAT